jgi:hypothetical protein
MASNAIVLENQKPGNPQSEWDLSGPASADIEGFATDISVNEGQTVSFKINTDSTDYRIDIYRLGYYDGMGARKVATIEHQTDIPTYQPAPLNDPSTGLIDAGNWQVTDTWNVPADAVSGVYIAKLVRLDGTFGENHIPFIVRNDSSQSDIVFQTSDTTWEAYNTWGGDSLYGTEDGTETGGAGRAHAVSYNRPFITRDGGLGGGPWDFVFGAEYPAIRWLEANGYDVSYMSGVDTDRYGSLLLNHKIFLDAGHDEYWSGNQRANVEAARDAGVNLAFWSGNEVYWKTRWEPSPTDGTDYRTLVSYKETLDGAKIDPSAEWTGTWRDPRFSPPADGGRPENALTGTMYLVDYDHVTPLNTITIPYDDSQLRFWRNTSVADLQPGQTFSLTPNYLGYEWDVDPDNGFRPAGLIDLSSTTISTNALLLDYGAALGGGTATHNLTLYRAGSGALVFSAGTVFWPWALDATHDAGPPSNSEPGGSGVGTPADINVQQAMVNLFADMGVQPATLQSGLVPAIQSTDHTAPVSTVTPPSGGYVVGFDSIQGTATDSGGGIVAGVEVSLDGGGTWHRASGTTNWSYSWGPALPGDYTIMFRAVDDSLNLSSANAVQVSVASAHSLDDFSWTHGWTTVDHLRQLADINMDGKAEYLGFGDDYTFVSYYGTWFDSQGNLSPVFSLPTALINDFGTAQGYTSAALRGAAQTGYGVADSIYAQAYVGIYWYGATTATQQTDAAGHTYTAPQYETAPHLYGDFGTQQGWTPQNGFDIVFASTADQYASVLGFGADGIVVGQQAFAPTATSSVYTVALAVGNSNGWDQTIDIRTFTDQDGNAIDLNHDGMTDFVGMGPTGLVYAYGSRDANGNYTLGSLQAAHVNGSNSDFGRPQGWNESSTLREIIHDPLTGYDDIIGFNHYGIYVAMGQDPATHGGEPFGQMYLAMRDMAGNQGWSHATTPRLVGDVSGDGIPDIVGFGASSTFTAVGSRDANGNLYFSMDWARTITDLGYNEGWGNTTVRALANVDGNGHDSLVLSGAYDTQVWQLMA